MLTRVFLLTYEEGAELVNFGAFIAFMGVNLAAFVHYKFRSDEKVRFGAATPVMGFMISLFIWINLSHRAQLLGVIWMAVGLMLYFVMHRRRTSVRVSEGES